MNRIFLVAGIAILCVADPVEAQTSATLIDDSNVVFEPLDLDNVVTCADVSDDGEYLVLAHEGDGQLTVYDILAGEVVGTIETPSPRTVIWRGSSIIVANEVDGAIAVFSDSHGWKQTAQIRMPRPGIKHIAAPRGKAFLGDVLVTCHGSGSSASYQDSEIYVVNINSKRFQGISKASLGLVSYDGRLLVLPESFNLSSSGNVSAFSYGNTFGAAAKPESCIQVDPAMPATSIRCRPVDTGSATR